MKILAGKREDILKRKAEYENKMQTYRLAEAGAKRAYYTMERNALQPITEKLESDLSKFNLLKFSINVRRGWKGAEVRIECEGNDTFRWSYSVEFNGDNEVEARTSSWSGMNATTAEDIAFLRQTVDALEYLLSVDWESLLRVEFPKYGAYDNNLPERPERENFDDLLAEAALEEVMGQNKAILVERFNDFYYPLWIKVIKSTNKFFVITTGPSVYSNNIDKEQVKNYDFDKYSYETYRVKKDRLIPVEPIEIVDLD